MEFFCEECGVELLGDEEECDLCDHCYDYFFGGNVESSPYLVDL